MQTTDKDHGAVLNGWHLVTDGIARLGDRYWSSSHKGWIPVVSGNSYLWADVSNVTVPVVIRSNKEK